MKKHKNKIIIFSGILLIIFGLLNIGWSQLAISRGQATGNKLTCSDLLIGASCEGLVRRDGGGDCLYNVTFYSVFDKTGNSELYIPLNTCNSSVKALAPITDLVFARTLSYALVLAGLTMSLWPFIVKSLKTRR
jgi:hypothetical protein